MTYQDLKLARPSKEMIVLRKELKYKLMKCTNLKEYEEIDKMIDLIDSKLKW